MTRDTSPESPPESPIALTPNDLSGLNIFADVDVCSAFPRLVQAPVLRLQPGEVALEAGCDNDALLVVLTGYLEVYLPNAPDQAISEVRAGDCVGEMSVIDSSPTSARVVAAEDSTLLVIDRPLAWHLIEHHLNFARNLLRILSRRLRAGNQAMAQGFSERRRLQKHAVIDELTGLHNRRWFEEAMQKSVSCFERDGQPFSMLMLDIDRFKEINDTHGHQAGDAVLRQMSSIIGQGLRPHDKAARYGGEEFAVILPATNLQQATVVAERLRAAVENHPFAVQGSQREPAATISVGMAQIGIGDSGEDLVRAADQALYRAKQAGRNQVSD